MGGLPEGSTIGLVQYAMLRGRMCSYRLRWFTRPLARTRGAVCRRPLLEDCVQSQASDGSFFEDRGHKLNKAAKADVKNTKAT
jgi:hypothetical protein